VNLGFVYSSLLVAKQTNNSEPALHAIQEGLKVGEEAYGTDYPFKPVLLAMSAVDPRLSDEERYKVYLSAIASASKQRLTGLAAFLNWQLAEILLDRKDRKRAELHYKESLALWERVNEQRLEPVVTRIRYAMLLQQESNQDGPLAASLAQFEMAFKQAESYLSPDNVVLQQLRPHISTLMQSRVNYLVNARSYREALPIAQRDVALWERAGDSNELAVAVEIEAGVLNHLGKKNESMAASQRAAQLKRDVASSQAQKQSPK
jgi:hypothetical protein